MFVESGFSINKSLLQENMKNESLVAQRIVFDGIQHSGYLKVNISNVCNSPKAYENVKEENLRGKQKLKTKKLRRKDCQLN